MRASIPRGACDSCHEEIKIGDRFVNFGGVFVHADCADDEKYSESPRNAEEYARSQQRDCHRPIAHHTRIA